MGKDIPRKCQPKGSKNDYIYSRKKTDKVKNCHKRPKRILCNNKRSNSLRYKNYKYIGTQHQSTEIYKANIDRLKRKIDNNNDWRPQYSTFKNGQNSQIEN